ncbi:MAG: YgiT-type zinc finger protein [Candidatus Heimdallarchaeota archaeon]|nr:YgiT-type zinc finger protein [Candidatus Heimdallarchaeota archaeon]
MKCLYCDGKLKKQKDIFHADRKGIHLTIDELELWKCEKCGEIMVESAQVKLIQKTLTDIEKALNKKVA